MAGKSRKPQSAGANGGADKSRKQESRSARMFTNRSRLNKIAKVVAITLIAVMVIYFCVTSSVFLMN